MPNISPHAIVEKGAELAGDVRVAYDWSPPAVRGVHEAGLAAAGLTAEEDRELRNALQDLFEDEAALQTKIEQLMNLGVEGEVAALCEFCLRSLRGLYGRFREVYRGKTPPEALEHPPPERRANFRRPLT